MADEPHLSTNDLAIVISELHEEQARTRVDNAVLVMGVYEFLIRQNLTTRQEVHDYLVLEASRVDETARKMTLKETLQALAQVFEDDTPEDTRSRLRLILGGLSDNENGDPGSQKPG